MDRPRHRRASLLPIVTPQGWPPCCPASLARSARRPVRPCRARHQMPGSAAPDRRMNRCCSPCRSARSLEDQARGSNTVETAATSLAGSLGRGSSAVDDFATTVRSISARIAGAPASAANDNGAATAAGGTPANDNTSNGDIVVVARRASALAGQGVAEQLINIVDQTFAAIGVKFPPVVTGVLKDTLGKLPLRLPTRSRTAQLRGSARASRRRCNHRPISTRR